MTLRARLLIAMLTLALLPTLVFTLFTLGMLGGAAGRWYVPSVVRALEAGVEVSRTALTRVEGVVLDRSHDWSASATLPLSAERRTMMRDGLRPAGLDFVQVYRLEHGRWRLVEQIVPAGVLAASAFDFSAELPAALAGDRLIRSSGGVLAGAAHTPGGGAIVTGIRLTPDFFARVADVGKARELYGRLDVVAEEQQHYVWLLVAVLALVLALAATLLARAIASQMTSPLRELAGAFERVAGGDLATRVPERGAREVRALATSFNAMAGGLSEAREQLAQAVREAAWREVARRLAHEIKNPLTPMRLSLHRLQRRVDLVPEGERAAVRESLAALLQEVEHLTRLAEHFSQFARLPEAEREPLQLGELARAAVALGETEHVRLVFTPGGPVRVSGDRLLLSLALHNLIKNACEASPAGGEVEVRTGSDGHEGWVEVLDRGPGVAPEVAATVFEPYVSTKNRGSGLGLSLVRDVAVQFGGRATLANREGGGASARLALPLTFEKD